MEPLLAATLLALLVFFASIISVELALSVAIIEIVAGVVAGNVLGITSPPWVDFIASFASVVLTFLAGAEVDPRIMRAKSKEALLVGGLSFLVPFVGAALFAYLVAGWDLRASQIAGIALSTTSLAVVYAVLVESGLTKTDIGKVIMAATFVTDLGTVLALSVLFVRPSPMLVVFVAVSIAAIGIMYALRRPFFARYGDRIIEPEIRGAFFVLLLLMWLADLADSHAVLPAFILGFVLSGTFRTHPEQQRRFRVVAFSFLTPFFFIRSGMNVSLEALAPAVPIIIGFFVVKIAAKFVGVMPVALRYLRPHATYTTLLMSTGLTFGTISALYGLNSGILDATQFSVLITVVILSAIVPTAIAQRRFSPPLRRFTRADAQAVEDEEFEPRR